MGWVINPSSTTWTEVTTLVTDSSNNHFIFRAIGVHIPENITISGGDLSQPYTFSLDDAAVNPPPPATPNLWRWSNADFSFTLGQTYTIFFN